MTPDLIIVRELDKANDVELSVYLANNVYLRMRWMRRVRLDARNPNVYIQRSQCFFCAIENRRVLRFVFWYLTMSHARRPRRDEPRKEDS